MAGWRKAAVSWRMTHVVTVGFFLVVFPFFPKKSHKKGFKIEQESQCFKNTKPVTRLLLFFLATEAEERRKSNTKQEDDKDKDIF